MWAELILLAATFPTRMTLLSKCKIHWLVELFFKSVMNEDIVEHKLACGGSFLKFSYI